MSLFSFRYKNPVTGQYCTVDSGKPTKREAFIDIVTYMRRAGLRKLAPTSVLQIKDECLRTVRSSHGVLTIDTAGHVAARELDNDDPDGGGHLATICRFDLGEWQRHWNAPLPASFDILCLGYWYVHPESRKTEYEPPDPGWRKIVADALRENMSEGGGNG